MLIGTNLKKKKTVLKQWSRRRTTLCVVKYSDIEVFSEAHDLFLEVTPPAAHLHQLKGEALVENAVDLGAARQVGCVHLIPRTLDAFFKVHCKLLHHPAGTHSGEKQRPGVVGSAKHDRVCVFVCACALTAARPWFCASGRQVGSSCTPPPPSPATAFGSATCCAAPAACRGCGWSVAGGRQETRGVVLRWITCLHC